MCAKIDQMKLSKKIPFKIFILSNILILILGLIFLAMLYYVLNIQYQKSTTPFSQGPVTNTPKSLRLDLAQPDDDSLSFQSSIVVSGQTSALKDILVFSDSEDLVVKSNSKGSFSTVLNLKEGINVITVAVFDNSGDSRSVTKTVYYSKEKL